jgi:predicted RecB family nuclease
MTLSGTDFEPVGGKWPVIPSADVEVDFDIEWDLDNRIYQWGLRIRDGHDDATARYQPVMSFAPLDDAAEAALADEMADRLTRLRADADRDGKSLKVFHWSSVELTQSARFPRVAAALSGVSVDLMAWFNREFFARGSSSIKAVAPLLGFDWGTEDAGGLTSQLRIEEARGTGPAAEAARAWCLRYNEDDVAAQAAIRDGLRRLGDEREARGHQTRH